MAGSQSGGFVQKEKFSILVWGHRLAAPAFKLKPADNPGFMFVIMNETALLAMQNATIAHATTSLAYGDDIGVFSESS
jgi:hypothetical protein